MWLRPADLIGLAIGFAIGGSVLVRYLPELEAWRTPPVQAAVHAPAQAEQAPRPRVVANIAPMRPVTAATPPVQMPSAMPAPGSPGDAMPAPAEMPIISFRPPTGGSTDDPLAMPNVVYPTSPRHNELTAGTGFFVASDGSLLTAAHVVRDCRQARILSRYVPFTPAVILASDPQEDIALLRAPRAHPPAILTLAPRPTSRRLFILGYPPPAGWFVAAETWGTLENDKFPQAAGSLVDPRKIIWMEAAAVTHGYSGGPIVDPQTGGVVGIVKGMVVGGYLTLIKGLPQTGITIGPGAGRLSAFLQQEAPGLDTTQTWAAEDDALDRARRATVHVVCSH
jgi:S1-C subfamily serine protease